MKIKTFRHFSPYALNETEETAMDAEINEFLSGVVVKNISVSTSYDKDMQGVIHTHTICYEEPAPKN